MAVLFCPVCSQERSTHVSTEKYRGGGKVELKRRFRCEVCGTTVRYENQPGG